MTAITLLKRSTSLILIALLIPAFIGLQIRYDRIQQQHFELLAPVHRFALPATVVKEFSFGFRNVLADYYWVTAIQDYNKWDKFDSYYPEYFRTISTLDPKFQYPYMFAALTVPSKMNATTSLEWLSIISGRGIAAFPDNWEIPFYTGVEYHLIDKEYATATRYIGIAASRKSSPEMVRSTYAIYLLHGHSEYETSRALFSTMLETSDDISTKIIAKEHIELLDLIEALERVGVLYKKKYGMYPGSLAELTSKGMITIPRGFEKKYPLSFNTQTGAVSLGR